MREIVWLHVSDFHMSQRDEWSQDVVLSAMANSVRQQRRRGLILDFILATGDLAFSGNKEEYRLVERFFDELISASGVPKERIFCVPGNHDVNRNRQKLCFHGARSTLTSTNTIDPLLTVDSDDLTTLSQRQRDYQDFQNHYFSVQNRTVTQDGLAYTSSLAIEEIVIAVIGLNSAWLAEGGSSDHGNLLIGERQIINAFDAVEEINAHIVIGMAHHPLHVLRNFDRSAATWRIAERCHFYHCGHLHHPESHGSGFEASACLSVTTGASFETRESQNTYSLVKLDLLAGTRTLTTVQYNPVRGEFVSNSEKSFPIRLASASLCTVNVLADAIIAFEETLAPHAYYLAALLVEQKAEIPIPGQSIHVFGSLAALQGIPDDDYCRKVEAFFRFQNVLTVLYGRCPLARLLSQYGQPIKEYGADLHARCQIDTQLGSRLAQQDSDVRALFAVQPLNSFAAEVLSDLALSQEWALLVTQARRHLENQNPTTQVIARRMLAFGLANSTEEKDRDNASREYETLIHDGHADPSDYRNFATLLLNLNRTTEAQAVILSAVATIPLDGLRLLCDIGKIIVEQTGDRGFREKLETAIAKRGGL